MQITKRKPWIWIASGCAALLAVGLLAGGLLGLRAGSASQDGAGGSTSGTQQSTQGTTLPPPPENVFDPADFVYGPDGYLTCTAGAYERGVDVSSFQGDIDWQAVADAGFTFAMIRVGGRGYSAGALYEDSRAQQNYAGAKAAGIKVGAYFFSQAISPEEAEEEAEYLLSLTRHWSLDMPVVYDWEYISVDARTGWVNRRTLTDCMLAFCRRIEAEGLESMVYFNPAQSRRLFNIEELTDYPFWLAMYSDWMTYPYRVDMWQYTNAGRVPGIEGDVDINLYFPYEDTVE